MTEQPIASKLVTLPVDPTLDIPGIYLVTFAIGDRRHGNAENSYLDACKLFQSWTAERYAAKMYRVIEPLKAT